MMARKQVLWFLAFLGLAVPAKAVDYFRLSPSEFAEDVVKASQLIEVGDFAAALDLLDVLVADEPDDADALSLTGYALRHLGEFEAAERAYLRVLQADPNHAGALQYLGELYVQMKQVGRASELLTRLDAVCGADCAGRDLLAAAIAAGAP